MLLRIPGLRRRALASNVHHPERVPLADAIALVRGTEAHRGYPESSRQMRANVVGDLSGLDVLLTIAWAEYDRLVRNRPLPEGAATAGAPGGAARLRPRPDLG